MMTADPRRHSPATQRNRAAILEILERVLPPAGSALEIASGSGEHAAHFAQGLPDWQWQPTDADADALASIKAWCAGITNVLPPLHLDVTSPVWTGVCDELAAIFCANMLHISPWSSCAALMQGAARHLSAQGVLLVYGPFVVADQSTAASNLAFDADLRSRNADWGLRSLDDVATVAAAAGLQLRERIAMPANNLILIWQRAPATIQPAGRR
jgi:hypothetical protein